MSSLKDQRLLKKTTTTKPKPKQRTASPLLPDTPLWSYIFPSILSTKPSFFFIRPLAQSPSSCTAPQGWGTCAHPPIVVELWFPSAPASMANGQRWWEVQSTNIWRPQVPHLYSPVTQPLNILPLLHYRWQFLDCSLLLLSRLIVLYCMYKNELLIWLLLQMKEQK